MSLIGVVSAKGSPGVSTVAMELLRRWPREVVGVELDPSGGSWALRHDGLTWDPGIVSLASSPGTMSYEFAGEHGHRVGKSGVAICAAPFGEQVRASLDLLEPRLGQWPDEIDGIVDVGRFDPIVVRVLSVCMVTIVVSRTRPEDLGQLTRLSETLRGHGVDARLLLIGSEPPFYSPTEIAQTVRLPRIDVVIPFASQKRSRRMSLYDSAFETLTETLATYSAVAAPVTAKTLAAFSKSLKHERRS
jgi:hypothetical protein